VTIGLGMGTFLLVVNDEHASILHRYGDISFKVAFDHAKGQKFTAQAPCHVTCRQRIKMTTYLEFKFEFGIVQSHRKLVTSACYH